MTGYQTIRIAFVDRASQKQYGTMAYGVADTVNANAIVERATKFAPKILDKNTEVRIICTNVSEEQGATLLAYWIALARKQQIEMRRDEIQ